MAQIYHNRDHTTPTAPSGRNSIKQTFSEVCVLEDGFKKFTDEPTRGKGGGVLQNRGANEQNISVD